MVDTARRPVKGRTARTRGTVSGGFRAGDGASDSSRADFAGQAAPGLLPGVLRYPPFLFPARGGNVFRPAEMHRRGRARGHQRRDPPAAADAAREQQRLRQAIDQTLADLIALTELAENKFHADIAAIFAGHHTLLDDDDLFDAANDRLLTEQCTAEWAWHQVLMELSQQYRQLDDPYLQARYIDIEDILQRTLRHLQGVQERVPTPGEPTIIIADNIYPSTVLQLDASFVKGLCLRDGSEQAHGAIIARAAGIAWLSQQGEALNSVQPGETIVLDMRHQRLIRD